MSIEGVLYDLNTRLKRLEQIDKVEEQLVLKNTSNQTLEAAQFRALCSMVQELAEREGLSRELFVKHFEERVRHYRDYLLRIAENINPSVAAQIDERTPADMPETETFPRLFD